MGKATINTPTIAVGLMSGTSADGIDAALVETDGEGHVQSLAAIELPYTDETRAHIRAATHAALQLEEPQPHAVIDAVAEELTLLHAEAVERLLAQADVPRESVGVIGFHGQTVAHRPGQGWTWQIGSGALLAAKTGIPVVHDFRSADVAAGGQGAPLLPVYHRALVRAANLPLPVAVLNLGGVGNVTWIGAGEADMLAFDTGPANGLIDDWMLAHTGHAMDKNGALAAKGRVHADILARMCDKAWFNLPPPKSLDRHDFSTLPCENLSAADGAATLTAFTAETVRLSLAHMPQPPRQWLITGGGRLNATLMQMMAERLGDVRSVDILGWRGDAMEAEGFAYMAVRSLRSLPISFPGTTGVSEPLTGGVLCQPSADL